MPGSRDFLLPSNHERGLWGWRARGQEQRDLEERRPERREGAGELGRRWALESRPSTERTQTSVKEPRKCVSPSPQALPDTTHNQRHIKTLSSLPLYPPYIDCLCHFGHCLLFKNKQTKESNIRTTVEIRDTYEKCLVYSRCSIGGSYFQCEATLALTFLLHILPHPPVPLAETPKRRPSRFPEEGTLPLLSTEL